MFRKLLLIKLGVAYSHLEKSLWTLESNPSCKLHSASKFFVEFWTEQMIVLLPWLLQMNGSALCTSHASSSFCRKKSQTREPPILLRMNNHLPDDIVLNILARLPVKSVLRMRCICQSWCSSITTPNFISTHTLVNNNKDHCYVIHNLWTTRDSRVAFDCHTFDRISEFGIPHDFPSECVIVGSCNGILCVAGCGSVSTDDVIYLWNPSIRKFKQLPNTCLGKLSDVKLGFAYHSENNDYKGKLAFITFGRSEQSGFRNSFYIWVMMEYGVLESWNKVFVGPLGRLSFYVAITEYGSLLLRRAIDLVKEDFELVLVDIETLHEKDPDIQDPHSCVAAFMGSLALLDGANMVSY
uniref:F-box domain-containing protein n=1 Tax=Fagus sylvatica TaxID=28930 RepID=A0A2N9GAB4_FAGSY